MSYIPPHKRHLKDPVRPSHVPDSLITKFKRTFDLKKAKEIVYSRDCIGKWFLIGSDETDDKVKLLPFSSDSAEYKKGEKPFVLLRNNIVKTEINPVRHLVVDVSCLDRNADMRLMLSTKRKLIALTEKETSNIKEILESATVDPNVEGGLRWLLGRPSSRDGYIVGSIDHIRATTYTNQTLRLIVREADRYNVRSGRGEVKREVSLILTDINTQLQEDKVERSCVLEMLRDALQTIWDFLSCDDA